MAASMSKSSIALVLLLFWAAVLIFVVALVWRKFTKWDRDDGDAGAKLRRYDEENNAKSDGSP